MNEVRLHSRYPDSPPATSYLAFFDGCNFHKTNHFNPIKCNHLFGYLIYLTINLNLSQIMKKGTLPIIANFTIRKPQEYDAATRK
jgi:hypothetical protein